MSKWSEQPKFKLKYLVQLNKSFAAAARFVGSVGVGPWAKDRKYDHTHDHNFHSKKQVTKLLLKLSTAKHPKFPPGYAKFSYAW